MRRVLILVSCLSVLSLGLAGQARAEQHAARPTRSSVPHPHLAVSNESVCEIRSHHVWCWGEDGRPESGSDPDSFAPKRMKLRGKVVAVSGDYDHTCALRADHSIWCWGRNDDGELGKGDTDSTVPIRAPEVKHAIQVSAGDDFTCALRRDGTVFCWGDPDHDELGAGDPGPPYHPNAVPIPKATDVSAGDQHACALTAHGAVWCWGVKGAFMHTRKGYGWHATGPRRLTRMPRARAVDARGDATCVLTTTRRTYCSGTNLYGEVGDGKVNDAPVGPHRVHLRPKLDRLAFGFRVGCVLRNHRLYCWGYNGDGKLTPRHDGPGDVLTPRRVPGVPSSTTVGVSENEICTIARSRGVYCWTDGTGIRRVRFG